MRALCGRVRTVVLLPFPWHYTTSSAACQYYFEIFFDLFSFFASGSPLAFCTTFFIHPCRCTTFCRMTQMSLTKCIKKHYKSRGNFFSVMSFDEIYRQYSSFLIIYKSGKMRYNSQAVVCESPRPVMPAFFMAQYFVTAKYQTYDMLPCGRGHCCAPFFILFSQKSCYKYI